MKKIALILIPVAIVLALAFKNNESEKTQANSVCDSLKMSAEEHLVMSVLWYQKSAEMRACYYQSFNMARMALDNKLKNAGPTDKNAVVLDVDETVLDNSPFEANMILTDSAYTAKSWKFWTNKAVAKPTPGVLDFLNYAKSKGVIIFYVTNRDITDRAATLKNMLNEKFPFADTTHILCQKKQSDKTGRYKSIAENYKILLTIGDNLRDYNEIFGHRKTNYGLNMADSLKNRFGSEFIIIPNPMYGDWEKAIYSGIFPSEVEKNKIRKAALQGYEH